MCAGKRESERGKETELKRKKVIWFLCPNVVKRTHEIQTDRDGVSETSRERNIRRPRDVSRV